MWNRHPRVSFFPSKQFVQTHADTHTGKRQRHKINYNGNAIKKESGERGSKGKEAKNWIDATTDTRLLSAFPFLCVCFFFYLRDGATLNNQKRKRKRMQIIREIRRWTKRIKAIRKNHTHKQIYYVHGDYTREGDNAHKQCRSIIFFFPIERKETKTKKQKTKKRNKQTGIELLNLFPFFPFLRLSNYFHFSMLLGCYDGRI